MLYICIVVATSSSCYNIRFWRTPFSRTLGMDTLSRRSGEPLVHARSSNPPDVFAFSKWDCARTTPYMPSICIVVVTTYSCWGVWIETHVMSMGYMSWWCSHRGHILLLPFSCSSSECNLFAHELHGFELRSRSKNVWSYCSLWSPMFV